MVDMGVNTATQKLNAAPGRSAAPALRGAGRFGRWPGVPISHYAEIDFDGFRGDRGRARRRRGGRAHGHRRLAWPAVTLERRAADAQRATRRSSCAVARHAYDECGDGDSVTGRRTSGWSWRPSRTRLLASPISATMASTVEALSRYVTTDFDVTEIVSLAQNLRGMDTGKRPVHRHGAYHVRVHQRDLVRAS